MTKKMNLYRGIEVKSGRGLAKDVLADPCLQEVVIGLGTPGKVRFATATSRSEGGTSHELWARVVQNLESTQRAVVQ